MDATLKEYFAALEAGDGARVYNVCAPDAKLFDSEGNVFLDMASFTGDDAAAQCGAALTEKMGGMKLKYSDAEVEAKPGSGEGIETHTVSVYSPVGGEEPVAVVRVRVVVAVDESAGKVKQTTEEVVGDGGAGAGGPGAAAAGGEGESKGQA
eukprot:g3631.t1